MHSMFLRVAAAAVLVLAGSLPVWSATLQSNVESFNFSGTSQALNFTQFDPSLGTLTGVTLGLLPGSGAMAQGFPTNNVIAFCGGVADITMGVNSESDLLGSVSLGFFGACGSSIVETMPIDRSRSLDSLGLGQFEGTGTVPVTLTKSAVFTTLNNASSTLFGTAQLTYTYDPVVTETVPEPSTWGLLAAGLAIGIRARRTRRQAVEPVHGD